jgi:two-component system OmpR family response regulator
MRENNSQILVVEDDRDIRNIVSTVLRNNGYECVTAGTASEGIRAFTENIKLVITDLNMPGDGISMIRSLRAIRAVSMIILTGFHKDYAEQLDQFGYITWLTKPIEFASLLDLVKVELNRTLRVPNVWEAGGKTFTQTPGTGRRQPRQPTS